MTTATATSPEDYARELADRIGYKIVRGNGLWELKGGRASTSRYFVRLDELVRQLEEMSV